MDLEEGWYQIYTLLSSCQFQGKRYLFSHSRLTPLLPEHLISAFPFSCALFHYSIIYSHSPQLPPLTLSTYKFFISTGSSLTYKYTKVSPIPPKNSFLSNCHIKLLPFLTLFFKWKASTGYLSLLSLLSSLSFPLYAILLLLLPLYRNCSCQGNQCPNFLV